MIITACVVSRSKVNIHLVDNVTAVVTRDSQNSFDIHDRF